MGRTSGPKAKPTRAECEAWAVVGGGSAGLMMPASIARQEVREHLDCRAHHKTKVTRPMATPSNNVHVLPGKRRVRQQQAQRLAPSRRRLAQQHAAAVAVAVVGVVLTGLSLAHLAHGIALLTQAPVWEAWSMAIGIDLAFVALELAQLCAATPTVAKTIGRFTKPAIVGTLVASAGMNALAFGAAATGWMAYPAIALGLAIPALIYCLSRVAFGLAASR